MGEVIIQPKTPNSKDWQFIDNIIVYQGISAQRWGSRYGHIAVTSVEAPEPDTIGPEYHMSLSKNGQRVSADEVPEILKIFDMESADEDNHTNGISRHFWQPVATIYEGYVCPCKETEHAITEGDFVWRPLD